MRTPPQIPRARRGHRLLPAFALAALASMAWATACSSIESTMFSDGVCVAGGCAQSTSAGSGGASSSSTAASSSSGMCVVDAGCAVTWSMDIYAGMLDTASAGCTGAGVCHGGGGGGITLSPGEAAAAYTTLMGYTLLAMPGPAKPYIVPCDPAGSGMLCNMKEATGPQCGNLMPLIGTNLTPAQLTTIADWISCGAPNN